MATETSTSDVRAVLDDPELQQFLTGEFAEPEERVSRKGVPEYRTRDRESRPAAEVWQTAKPEILRLARIRRKVRKFKYTPIREDQIRLLRVRPAKETGEVLCDLCVKNLNDATGQYEALSYCWGSEEPTEVIKICKLEQVEPGRDFLQSPIEEFPVRPNLLKALRHLRREDKSVILWIDAICIDQTEYSWAKEEKSRQLSMMSGIYNSARNVCIWLGDAELETTMALKLVNDITNFQVLDKRLRAIDSVTQLPDMAIKDRWSHLISTLKNTAWFGRRWIIQEIASSRSASVHCGKEVVHWDDLADAISLLHENYEALEQHFGDDTKFAEQVSEVPSLNATHLVKALANVCRKSSTGEISERLLDFETLVCTFQQFHARFSEDIIHSVRSLAKDAPDPDIEREFQLTTEYKNSTRDLFIAFVERCISKSRSYDIICRHWAPAITDSAGEKIQLPTWISELGNGPYGVPGEAHERQNGENFVALSSHDKRKRYNASQDWGQHKPASHDNFNPNRRVQINAEPTQPRYGTERLMTDINYSASPLSVSMPQSFSPLSPTTVDRFKEVASKVPVQGTTHLPSEQTATNTNPDELKSQADPSIHDQSENQSQSQASGAKPTTRQRRATTLLSVWQDAAMFPGRMREQHLRRGSTSRQDRYIQVDKEHLHGSPGILNVQGFVLGAIKDSSDLMRDGIVPGDWLQKLGWSQDSHENRVPEILWRTLVADRSADGGNPPAWYQRACLHCLKDPRLTNSRGDLNSHKVAKVAESMTSRYLKRVESVIWRRRLIEVKPNVASKDDFLYGMGPEHTKTGDLVCIIVGCSVPVVLRTVPRTNSYELVGEAYIHGKMDGEAVHDRVAINREKRIFSLQ
ncbi:hypothetical protein EJ04DRAFT_575812 [Polyplosphaeria fusca]|uniref:Heterokaryon incompatibility domain-containing protein n=1 Tax=Polyplosphaeria fusca TaxID=682080 RepID=A0A9P4R2Y7_9PLEO|nr:hypothetical protein EJ04DRAFT_575812 [Polyplosphaeria fusca]